MKTNKTEVLPSTDARLSVITLSGLVRHLALVLLVLAAGSAQALTIVKTNNTTALNATGS